MDTDNRHRHVDAYRERAHGVAENEARHTNLVDEGATGAPEVSPAQDELQGIQRDVEPGRDQQHDKDLAISGSWWLTETRALDIGRRVFFAWPPSLATRIIRVITTRRQYSVTKYFDF